ncbi:potassium/proton antiporter [Gephyromycinifex aptenodytis]|uniref:potassium/proton antiporter n=1 Tax=Gephyromycinifex aptenodytis TaxID=2716227 RepID=UPI00144896F5|nr:potassium/proton antiporter [Gephyromycinifex aptenodytis]
MSDGGGFTVEDLGVALAVSSAVLLVAVAAVRLAVRSGLPTLLLYLGIGLILGQTGLHEVFTSLGLARVLGYAALILILAEGGLTTSWPDIKPSVAPAALLSTLGVAVSVGVIGFATHVFLHADVATSLLIGAILSSTDAAAVFSVLREVRVPSRLTGVLEAESGFNDAPVVLLVVALSEHIVGSGHLSNPFDLLLLIALELAGGAFIGIAVGYLGGRVMRHLSSAAAGLVPIGVLSWTLLAYGLASVAHTSGFIAVYLSALVLGNMRLPHRVASRGFAQALGWLAQIGLFVMLGMLADAEGLLEAVPLALILGLVLLLVARPLSVFASTVWFRTSWRDQIFLSWAGLRGAVPIVLAIVPLLVGVPGISWLFNVVVVLVVIFTVVQGPSMPWVAKQLGVDEPERPMSLDVESTPLDKVGAELLEVEVGERSLLHGLEIFELRLPTGSAVSLVVRGGETFVPTLSTRLHHGDQMLIVAPFRLLGAVEERLRAVDNSGRLAGWSAAKKRSVTSRRPPPRPRS